MELQERIKLLERKLLDAKKKYYGLDEENDFDEIQLLDAEYDQLEEELRKIDPNNPESLPIPKLLNSYVICRRN